MTAKQLYDNIAGTRQETATAPYLTALENFLQVRFGSDADRYIDTFLSTLQGVDSAADAFFKENPWNPNNHSIDNELAPLQTIMSSLRSTAGNREQPANAVYAATGHTQNNIDPEADCTSCRHKHKNKVCFIQHPELRRKGGTHRKNKGKKPAPTMETDSEDEDRFRVASARVNENLTIYDTGASHFVSQTKSFIDLKPCPKPFKFDQAVGAAPLQQQGNAQLIFGYLTL
ncbi:hypothetical protein K3495_g2540 [Podosphaera aphanis]|nr:hypothetical protein K3495_g2540 [Podosphaera aphanis]